MSNRSNDLGRAYELAFLCELKNKITDFRAVKIISNSSYDAARRAWDTIDTNQQVMFLRSSAAAIDMLIGLEPMIIEHGSDILELKIQPDEQGKLGDVRDIIISRKCDECDWEIGLSIKHNHFAVKHSRLAKGLDFGEKWFGVSCSKQYWNDVQPIFEYLSQQKANKKMWSELPSKSEDVYKPLLQAFIDEINRCYMEHGSIITQRMVEYLLGYYDFYKVISIDKIQTTQIQAFNIHGTLNKESREDKPITVIPVTLLPTRIFHMDFKPESDNTVELSFDNGWQFNFRIHNASTYVETSLKFDIQIVGMPTTIISINCRWN
jgi:hypothetical protein